MLQGAGGMIVWPPEFLAGVRRLCDRFGTLLIADEVLTGFGRTGRMFACEHARCRPTSCACRRRSPAATCRSARRSRPRPIYDAFLSDDRTRTFFHGHSFTANPLACAVAVASLDLFQENDTLVEGPRRSNAGCTPDSSRCARCRSSATCASSAASASSSSSPTRRRRRRAATSISIGPRLTAAFLDRGLLLRPLGNVLYFMPPYVITEAETAWALEQIASVLGELARRADDRLEREEARVSTRKDRRVRTDPTCRELRAARAVRRTAILWAVLAFVAWNAVFDRLIVLGGRQYIRDAVRREAAGSYLPIDDGCGRR